MLAEADCAVLQAVDHSKLNQRVGREMMLAETDCAFPQAMTESMPETVETYDAVCENLSLKRK